MSTSAPEPSTAGGEWLQLSGQVGEPELRCWWARPSPGQTLRGAVLVLPEVFGINPWVRSVADRLAGAGFAALVLPVFARTAPGLALGYGDSDLVEGRRHRDQVTAAGLLADARRAIVWLQQQDDLRAQPLGCVGFCFGGHLALLVATLPQVDVTCSFYGARVASFRPGGGSPTLDLVGEIRGDLLCLCGDRDPLMPPEELAAIAAAMAASGSERRRELLIHPGAGHGFMCEARPDFSAEASAWGWAVMLQALGESSGLNPNQPR